MKTILSTKADSLDSLGLDMGQGLQFAHWESSNIYLCKKSIHREIADV